MDRKVRAVKRDRQGNITALCNPGESWSPRRVTDVVRDIRLNKTSYYVQQAASRRYVRLIGGRLLRTTPDATDENSLLALPAV
jgi:hypothetical protein